MAIQVDDVLLALADPTRRRIVEMLGSGPRRAGAVAREFDSAGPTISRHLRVLRESGLIEESRDADDARAKVYGLRHEPLGDLGAWLDQVQAFWGDQLAGFVDHVRTVPAPAGRESE